MVAILVSLLIPLVNAIELSITLWPINSDGTVRIPFFFDDATIKKDDSRRTTFLKAVGRYKDCTCIEWVQVPRNETPGNVLVRDNNQGCSTQLGLEDSGTNNISLSGRCNKLGIMLHEMAHTLGMGHTHQRPDRDSYVEIWKQNVMDAYRIFFDIMGWKSTYGTPYDYLSIMHYSSMHFSFNKLYTITPKNRMALYAMGSNRADFRWSDVAWINKAYNCERGYFLKKCSPLNCLNGGYVGKDCKCNCPENTKGAFCQTITGDLFNEKPKCGGIVRTEKEVSAYGVQDCVYQIIAPRCYIAEIIVTEAAFPTSSCNVNRLILHFSNAGFGHVYCDRTKIPIGQPIFAKSSEAAIYYTSSRSQQNFGFTARISFFKNLDWPSVNDTSQNKTANKSLVILNGPCELIELENHGYIYATPNFPSQVACFAECSAEFKTPQNSSLVFYEVNIQKQYTGSEILSLHDPVLNHIVTAFRSSPMPVLMWPFEVKFIGSNHPGKGFRVTFTPAKRIVYPCEEMLKLSVNETKTITNPLLNTVHTLKTCIFKIETERGHQLECSFTNLGRTILKINTNYPNTLEFVKAVDETYKSTGNSIFIHYSLGRNKVNWSMICKAAP